jgi:hypothetical protein
VTHHLRTATHRAQTVLGLLLQQSLRDDDTCEKDAKEEEGVAFTHHYTSQLTNMKLAASLLVLGGNWRVCRGACRISCSMCCVLVLYQGGSPVSISNVTIPRFHQSTAMPCP